MKETEINYYCPYCETDTNLVICIDSPTEYYISEEYCPNCDAQIEGGNSDKLAYEAVTDYYATQADFLYDDIRDRNAGVWGGTPQTLSI